MYQLSPRMLLQESSDVTDDRDLVQMEGEDML